MNIQLEWHDDNEDILLQVFPRIWNVQDFYQLVDATAEKVQQKSHTVNVIRDFHKSRVIPRSILDGMRYQNERLPENQGIMVFVGAPRMLSVFVKIGKQMGLSAANKIYTAESMEDALVIIRKQKQTGQITT